MPKPTIRIAKFHQEHDKAWGQQPTGILHNAVGSVSRGFLRGTNLEVGYKVLVSRAPNRKWSGTITEKVHDGYSQSEGDAFLFVVTRLAEAAGNERGGGGGDDTITVTVVTTDPTPISSDPTAPSNPKPTDVP